MRGGRYGIFRGPVQLLFLGVVVLWSLDMSAGWVNRWLASVASLAFLAWGIYAFKPAWMHFGGHRSRAYRKELG